MQSSDPTALQKFKQRPLRQYLKYYKNLRGSHILYRTRSLHVRQYRNLNVLVDTPRMKEYAKSHSEDTFHHLAFQRKCVV